jgi:hypothetical protein
MFHVIDKMSPYLPESMQCRSLRSKILEGVVLIQLGLVSILGIKLYGVLIVTGYLVTILVAWSEVIRSKLHLIYKVPEL